MLTKEERARLSGENQNGGAPRLELNQIKLNGKKGVFVYEYVKEGLVEQPDGKKAYRKESLGSEIDVVFLKIRRKLSQYRKGEKSLVTTEHNHTGQKVVLYGNEKIEKGIASDLREEYPQLRTQQVVYAIFKGELVRLILKGASLGSQSKAKDTEDFYSYISSFSKNKAADEHFYECVTKLFVIEETSDMGQYFCASYRKGEKLNDAQQEFADKNLKLAADHCKEADEYYQKFFESDKPVAGTDVKSDDIDVMEYPDENVNVEDIPF